MIWYGFAPSWRLLLLPAFVILAVLASLGPALFITALNVKYRDFRYIIPFIVQFGLYVSPVGFSSTVVPEHWRFWYSLNPMVGVIDGFRWCILGGEVTLYLPGFLLEPRRGRAVPVARHCLFPAHRAVFRGPDLMAGDVVIRAEGLGKKYLIGHETERERYTALRDVHRGTARNVWKRAVDAARGRAIVRGDDDGGILGAEGRELRGQARRGARHHRPQWRRQVDAPEDPVAHHRAERGARHASRGRVASLLEVGTGFHPELTGRENIYLNGAILGMTRAEIRRKFDEIVAFAEVESFFDTPVKRYSSGMYVRLAFAVAAHLEPEILIVDEVLAVGDAEFQKKCLGKMSEVAGGGRTVLFVSHNMAAVEALCPRSIHLATTVVQVGETDQVVASYLDQSTARSLFGEQHLTAIQDGLALERVRIVPSAIPSGDSVHLEFPFRAERTVDPGMRNSHLLGQGSSCRNRRRPRMRCGAFQASAGRFTIRAQIAALPVVEGSYTLGLWLVTDDFAGTLLELEHFTVGSTRWSHSFAPYAVEHRGVVVLQAEFGGHR